MKVEIEKLDNGYVIHYDNQSWAKTNFSEVSKVLDNLFDDNSVDYDDISISFKEGIEQSRTNWSAFSTIWNQVKAVTIPDDGRYQLNTDVGLLFDGYPIKELNKHVALNGDVWWLLDSGQKGVRITFLAENPNFSIHKITSL